MRHAALTYRRRTQYSDLLPRQPRRRRHRVELGLGRIPEDARQGARHSGARPVSRLPAMDAGHGHHSALRQAQGRGRRPVCRFRPGVLPRFQPAFAHRRHGRRPCGGCRAKGDVRPSPGSRHARMRTHGVAHRDVLDERDCFQGGVAARGLRQAGGGFTYNSTRPAYTSL